jgi:signal transduction histidine kinase
MKRSWPLWIAFLLCLSVVLTAMGWVSLTALQLDRAEAKANRQAALEENVRLALWRMDSAMSPIVAHESARPYFAYSTFLPVNRAYGRMFNPKSAGEMLIPSPLLNEGSPYALVYFQFEPDGRLSSPLVPAGNNYPLAVPKYLSPDLFAEAKTQLGRVAHLVDRRQLMVELPQCIPASREVVLAPAMANSFNANADQQARRPSRRYASQLPSQGDADELNQRVQAVKNTTAIAQTQRPFNGMSDSLLRPMGPTDVNGVLMTPLWAGADLILARRIVVSGQEYVQGCLLDWPAIREWLLQDIGDLLPAAALEPVRTELSETETRRLASLPVRLIPGLLAPNPDTSPSPVRLILAIAWMCVLLAAAAVAALLWGVLRLSDRRAAFVSAVTHELRTPLTTFHMYTEMLTEGMVPDAGQQQHYLHTLRIEASRLSHLVENVLSYARLERGRANGRIEDIRLRDLVARNHGRLADRARQAGMDLVVEGNDDAFASVVRANPSAVEQILFNLVDNACKYAVAGPDKRIHLAAARQGDRAQLGVRDHGPGIARPASRRLFRPFSKSAHEAANTAPGVGLGLALSRRLARDMGGRLDLDQQNRDGASFVLVLPTVITGQYPG